MWIYQERKLGINLILSKSGRKNDLQNTNAVEKLGRNVFRSRKRFIGKEYGVDAP